MQIPSTASALPRLLAVVLAAVFVSSALSPANAQSALRQAIAAGATDDPVLQQFYEQRNYEPIWMGNSSRERRRLRAFLGALQDAGDHGLPTGQYEVAALSRAASAAQSNTDRARAELALSRAFADYARDVQSGVLEPSRVSREIDRAAPRRGQAATLVAFSKSSPSGFLNSLPPQSDEYERLFEEKAQLERVLGAGGFGQRVPRATYQLGDTSNGVVILRNRLAAQGYGRSGGSASFDQDLQQTVARFQRDHGLSPDGVAGPTTLDEVNRSAAERLAAVLVAMERERWMNYPLGRRHVLVNIPDFRASLIENGRTTFSTRAVVGQNRSTHRTPEFSDVMEFMVINPTWNVPRSITVSEYLPLLKQDRNAVGHLQLLDQNGQPVSRSSVNFASYSAESFPYRLKEPPSQGNALGLVKFMFPNRHNVYLHDTPQKALFARNPRAFSHGCVRLAEPFDFAYALLDRQASNPQAVFQQHLQTGRESFVNLEEPPRVHILYRTAFAFGADDMQFRPDIYGRDKQIWAALSREGVMLRAAGG